jgi:hypothetical protein
MTRDDRPTSRDRDPTNPDGIAARKSDAPVAHSGAGDSSRPNESSRKVFNPWRFGFHTVSPDHRRELLEMQLPETPAERLFDPSALDAKADASGSAPPALTVDAGDEMSDASDSGRKADTLRLRRGPPLVHPLRFAAPWAAGAALIVIALLWLATGKSDSQSPTAAKPAPTSAAPVLPAANATRPAPNTTGVAIADKAASNVATSAAPAASTAPAVAPKRAEVAKASQTAAAPAAAPATSAPALVQPPPAKKPATPDDASPFGAWTAPPRD